MIFRRSAAPSERAISIQPLRRQASARVIFHEGKNRADGLSPWKPARSLPGRPRRCGRRWDLGSVANTARIIDRIVGAATLARPAGMPLTPVVPAPAEPAFGVPTAFPDAAPPAVAPPAPVPCAKALTGNSSTEATAIAIVVDFLIIVSFVG
jgi:hypothetical protein